MRQLASRHPLLFSLAVTAGFLIVAFTAIAAKAGGLLVDTSLSLYVALLLTLLGWWSQTGFTKRITLDSVVPALPFLLISLLLYTMVGDRHHTVANFLYVATFCLMTGFIEEGLFRGIVFGTFRPYGLLNAAVGSSLLFGFVHLFNAAEQMSLDTACVQAVLAFYLGLVFAGIYARSGVIWVVVLAHALIDFAAFVGRDLKTFGTEEVGFAAIIASIIIFSPIGMYGLWLLKRVPKDIDRNAADSYRTE